MPELLKSRYNYELIYKLALSIKTVYHLFPIDNFVNDIINEAWNGLELKALMR